MSDWCQFCGTRPSHVRALTEALAESKKQADLAAEREADMARLLLYAECPECDGSGVKEIDAGGELAQCQWCHERDATLATHEHNEGEL